MQTPDEIRRDLSPELDRSESESLIAVAMRLQATRPTPPASLRETLRPRLVGAPAKERERTQRAVLRLAATYVGAGALLLAIAAIGLAGAGPFAAS